MSFMRNLIIVVPVFAFLMSCLHAMYPSQPFGRDKVREALNGEIFEAIVAPNQNKYIFLYPPDLSRSGLTYCIDVVIFAKNIRCKSVEEVELVHKQIYRDFFSKLNSIRIIRPFLAEFPLTPNSLYLSITFLDGNGTKLRPPYFSEIITQDKSVTYQSVRFLQEEPKDAVKDRKSGPWFKVIKEVSVSEANWLKEFFSPSVPRKKADSKVKVPTYSRPSPGAFAIGTALFGFAKKFADGNGLGVITIGTAGEKENDSRAFDLVLCGGQCITLEEAKKLAATCSKELLEFVRKDQECLAYLKDRSTWVGSKDSSTFPEPRHTAFRISFWDENIDRQPAPFIAEIRVIGDTFKYFTADEGQRLVLVHEETFDEAQAYLKSLSNI